MPTTTLLPKATILALLFMTGLLAPGCASGKKQPAPEPSKSDRAEEYVTGIAAAFYCSCERWPASWAQLRRFDDALHALSQESGKAPLPRFAWSDYPDAETGVTEDGGYLKIALGSGASEPGKSIAVSIPDCSRFDRQALVSACVQAGSVTAAPAGKRR